jgi:hypothetical protein
MRFEVSEKIAGAHVKTFDNVGFATVVDCVRAMLTHSNDKLVIWHDGKRVAEISPHNATSWIHPDWRLL